MAPLPELDRNDVEGAVRVARAFLDAGEPIPVEIGHELVMLQDDACELRRRVHELAASPR
jgi:hypothetical protein